MHYNVDGKIDILQTGIKLLFAFFSSYNQTQLWLKKFLSSFIYGLPELEMFVVCISHFLLLKNRLFCTFPATTVCLYKNANFVDMQILAWKVLPSYLSWRALFKASTLAFKNHQYDVVVVV